MSAGFVTYDNLREQALRQRLRRARIRALVRLYTDEGVASAKVLRARIAARLEESPSLRLAAEIKEALEYIAAKASADKREGPGA